jgi:hypothetical protein
MMKFPKLIKAFRDQTKASWSAFAIAATLVRERIVVASIPNILSYARDLGLHKCYPANAMTRGRHAN